ncbi:HET-domain-containing protein [Cadophora sp. DSE1049]|nr:HET-domain-containing protein [Cadophora sp. DSE1049]
MATIAKLCSTCTDIFQLKNGQKSSIPPKDNNTYHDHHTTLESLREAVRQDCFICTKAWSYFGKECQTDWTNDLQSWKPLTYNLVTLETIALSIRWSSPYLAFTTPAKFHLTPTSGPALEKNLSLIKEASETSSALSLGQAYQWYMSCRSRHTQCHRLLRTPRWCPTRLLDIGLEGEPSWKLQITSVDIRTPPLYMTLSYTWGSSSSLKLIKSNIDACRRGSLIRDLPRTFRDMITVARRFSIRYIWIDSLCIIQDSKEDWEKEASLMRDVYANSSCNIAAATSADPHGGLFRSRHAIDIQYGLVWSNAISSTGQFYHILDEAYWDRQVSDAVLHRRGWALQERLLPPRTLHFTEHQIFWECFLDQKCEAFPCGPPAFLSAKTSKPIFELQDSKSQGPPCATSTIAMWNDIVKRYTRCALTVPNDKIVDLSGLAKLYQDATGDDYIAGLWKSHILEGLNWYVLKPTKRAFSEYRAPSWSWAATDGAVGFNGSHSLYLARFLDVQIVCSTLDPTGQVYGGFIDLEAVVIPAIYSKEDSRYFSCHLKIGDHNVGEALAYEDNLGEGFGDDSEVHCLALSHCDYTYTLGSSVQHRVHLEGIFLRPIPDALGSYTRIGYFEIADEDAMKEFGIRVDPKTKDVTQDEIIFPSKVRIL